MNPVVLLALGEFLSKHSGKIIMILVFIASVTLVLANLHLKQISGDTPNFSAWIGNVLDALSFWNN